MSRPYRARALGQMIEWWQDGDQWHAKNLSTGQVGTGETRDQAFFNIGKQRESGSEKEDS
ncbi:MAG: hypothetical protein Q8L60_10445 [Gammaproteobacteria bacterium]|nr:hypothetical protein [Gammaproteobacteria bacterium]MDP2346768.1 hypothetical protein [Gammaproteobacteria bacterium]